MLNKLLTHCLPLTILLLTACNTTINARISSIPEVSTSAEVRVSGDVQNAAETLSKELSAPLAVGNYRFIGRIVPGAAHPDAQQIVSFAGSTIQARFVASAVTVHLVQDGSSVFEVILDGQAPSVINPGEEATTFSGLDSNVVHTLQLIKRNEAAFGIGFFNGITLAVGGVFAPPIATPARRIEIIGAAAAQGFGNQDASTACQGGSNSEDVMQTFGMIAGRNLGADVSVIGGSGLGILHNADGSTSNTLVDVWGRGNAADSTSVWNFASYQPDLVVLNLGAADYSQANPSAALFFSNALAFAQRIRSVYPQATILCTVDPTLAVDAQQAASAQVKAVVAAMVAGGDAHVAFADMGQVGTAVGCAGQPNVSYQHAMAAVVVAAAQASLAW